MEGSSTGIKSNIAGLLCYLFGWITGLIFVLVEKEDKFVRFHAMQSVVVFGGLFIIGIIGGIIPLLNLIIVPLVSAVSFILWLLLMFKAYRGEYYKLPWAGDFAERSLKDIAS